MPLPQTAILISANAEWAVVSTYFSAYPQQSSPLGNWFRAEIRVDGRAESVLFFHGGWGKIAAAASTQYVIDRWSPTVIINLGTCGGFRGEIELETVILVNHTLVYDLVEQMVDPALAIAHYTTELDLSWLTEPYPQLVRRTTLISADRDILVAEVDRLKADFGAVAADWETAAIAYVARRHGLKTLILRGVTDLVGGTGDAYDGQEHVFVDGTRRVMTNLLTALPDWLSLISRSSNHHERK
jgi:adenosylhomocysteine nucleosidase